MRPNLSREERQAQAAAKIAGAQQTLADEVAKLTTGGASWTSRPGFTPTARTT